MVVFSGEWLPCQLRTAHSPCVEGRLNMQLVLRLDYWNETDRHDGGRRKRICSESSRAWNKIAGEVHVGHQGEGHIYVFSRGHKTDRHPDIRPASSLHLEWSWMLACWQKRKPSVEDIAVLMPRWQKSAPASPPSESRVSAAFWSHDTGGARASQGEPRWSWVTAPP